MQAASCAISFSSLVRRKAAKEGTLRRGRFRFLPLLRTSLIETAKGACGPPLDSPGSGGKTVQKTSPPAPRSAKRSVSARKQWRQPIPRLHPVLEISPDIRGDRLNDCRRETRVQAPFSFLHRARRCLSFRASTEKKDRGAESAAAAGGRKRRPLRSAAAPLAVRREAGPGMATAARRAQYAACPPARHCEAPQGAVAIRFLLPVRRT